MKLNAQQLRQLEERRARGVIREVKRRPIYFILEDIYDTYNIGGLFRLADALAIEKMYLVGVTETPPNSRIKKASIGTYKVVPWEYRRNSKEVINELRRYWLLVNCYSEKEKRGNSNLLITNNESRITIIAVEQHPKAILYTKANYQFPIALIFGNESYGVRPETLNLVDQVVEIPMYGINKSLNVIVAASIVGYWIAAKLY